VPAVIDFMLVRTVLVDHLLDRENEGVPPLDPRLIQEVHITSQELAAAIVKIFEPNPELLHAVFDVISEERIANKTAAVQRLLEVPADTSFAALEAIINDIIEQTDHN
jgi:hypothetical protein